MYGNLIIALLTFFLLYMLFIEYIGYVPDSDIKYPLQDINNNVNGDTFKLEYKSDPKFEPVKYSDDYKPELNQESLYQHVPYYDYIKKDILPDNQFTLAQELTHQEMSQYLKSIKDYHNGKIPSSVTEYFNKINRKVWRKKEILSKTVFGV